MIGVVLGTGWDVDTTGLVVIPRRHLYDGWSVTDVVAPIREAIADGVDTVILTNACGTLNPFHEVGEVVSISDHLNLSGSCPDVGFLPSSAIYTPGPFRPAVYAQVRGPAFETPAEARMLRLLGADVVGMSTAVEALAAAALGCRVLGLSLVTDVAGGSDGHPEVLAAAGRADLDHALSVTVKGLS